MKSKRRDWDKPYTLRRDWDDYIKIKNVLGNDAVREIYEKAEREAQLTHDIVVKQALNERLLSCGCCKRC